MKPEEVCLSLGGNMGDVQDNLLDAIVELANRGIVITAVSGIYLTAPVGCRDQDDFLNMIVVGRTTYAPRGVLAVCQEVEKKLGRVRSQRWGPRTIDIDIIFLGGREINEEGLQVPHPRLRERAFVLVPLQEVAPQEFKKLNVFIPLQKVVLKIPSSDVTMMLQKKGLLLQKN